MAEGNWNNTLKVINSSPANTLSTSTPEDIFANATQGVIYIWSAWAPYPYTPLSSGNYWTYFLFRSSQKEYSIFYAMASGTLYKYNFAGSAWVKFTGTAV